MASLRDKCPVNPEMAALLDICPVSWFWRVILDICPINNSYRGKNIPMRNLLCIVLSILSTSVYAIDVDMVIAETAKRTYTPIEEVRQHYKTGCSSGVTPWMNICSAYHTTEIDMELNAVFQRLIKQLNTSSAVNKLKKAQRAWIKFRDLSCDYSSDGWSGGTGRGIIYGTCFETLTEARTKQLKEYLECTYTGCPGDW